MQRSAAERLLGRTAVSSTYNGVQTVRNESSVKNWDEP